MLCDVDDIVIIGLLVFPANYTETCYLGHNFNYRLHYVYHLSAKATMEFDATRYEYETKIIRNVISMCCYCNATSTTFDKA